MTGQGWLSYSQRGHTPTCWSPFPSLSTSPHTWPGGPEDSIDDNRAIRSDFAARSCPPGTEVGAESGCPREAGGPPTAPQQAEGSPQVAARGRALCMHPRPELGEVQALITAQHAGWSPAILLHLIRGALLHPRTSDKPGILFDLIKPG